MATEKIGNPLISVIVPVYNGALYLKKAIESILTQSYTPIEIIVVDDGSTDGSAELLTPFLPNICYYYQQNAGVGAARNAGIHLAKGEYISFLDQDDWLPDNKLESLKKELERTNAMAVLGKTQFVFETEAARMRWPNIPADGIIFTELLGAYLFRKEVFYPSFNGFFIPEIAPGEDIEWFKRLKDTGLSVQKVDTITLNYRQHELNVSNSDALYHRGLTRSIKYIIDQKRRS